MSNKDKSIEIIKEYLENENYNNTLNTFNKELNDKGVYYH